MSDPPEAEYVIAKTDCLHTREIASLRTAGFAFHERFIKVKINIGAFLRQLPAGLAGGDVTIQETRGFTDEMLNLAVMAYGTDRRFHLEPGFDNDGLAREMITAAAREYEANGAQIVTAAHGGELLGFCAFLPCEDGYRNVMGLTARNMKGKLAAWPLYTGALRLLASGWYTGNISSSNVASLNLHIRLGGRVVGTEDWYILRRCGQHPVKTDQNGEIAMLTEQLISYILHKLPGQTFSIRRVRGMWTAEEEERFGKELEYLTGRYPLETIGEGYVRFTLSVMEETKYFKAHGDYRSHSFAEVNERVYADEQQTTYYMLGLSVTEYLWETVLRIHRFYENIIRQVQGEKYLEIGPGHGKYFREACELGRFKKYVAVDVSPTAIAMTEEYMQSEKSPGGGYTNLSVRTPRCLIRRRNMTLSWRRKSWSTWRTRRACSGRSASCCPRRGRHTC